MWPASHKIVAIGALTCPNPTEGEVFAYVARNQNLKDLQGVVTGEGGMSGVGDRGEAHLGRASAAHHLGRDT